MFTEREVERAIEGHEDFPGWSELSWAINDSTVMTVELAGAQVPVVKRDARGGSEGNGSNVWVVVRVGTEYFRKTGFYDSWDGTEWDGDFSEVRPRETVITVYETV